MGGASLEEPVKEGEGPKMNGSVMIALADTKDEVLEKIRKDVYYTSGVWDESKVSNLLFCASHRDCSVEWPSWAPRTFIPMRSRNSPFGATRVYARWLEK